MTKQQLSAMDGRVGGGQRVSGTVGPGAGIKSSQIFPKVNQKLPKAAFT